MAAAPPAASGPTNTRMEDLLQGVWAGEGEEEEEEEMQEEEGEEVGVDGKEAGPPPATTEERGAGGEAGGAAPAAEDEVRNGAGNKFRQTHTTLLFYCYFM